MSNIVWELAAITFGILSVIGATVFVICFNIAAYKRNKRIEKKGYRMLKSKKYPNYKQMKTDQEENNN